ncbi:MAG: 4,5-DOPA dioxygenase extradiol [Candidatus Eiseniibacteriota bacterium]
MTAARIMPTLFVGHGSPMNAIEDNEFSRSWRMLAGRLPRPRTILCVSAHWQTEGVAVTADTRPATIHDFYGFPYAHFAVDYPAPGDPALAQRIAAFLAPTPVRLAQDWGLDHGTWSVLRILYPEADIPVLQLGLDTRQPGRFHGDLARRLAPLRDEGVLVVGSGNIVHNLRFYWRDNPPPLDWADRFDGAVRARIASGDLAALCDYEKLGPDARLAVPTPEHYLPLLYVLALRRSTDRLSFFNTVVTSAISMTSVLLEPAAG